MKTYKLKPTLNSRGLVKVSLVKEPAIEENLIYFKAESNELLRFVNEEKREIYAPVLIPNKLIFRKDIKGEPAQVFFDEEGIKELHLLGAKNSYDKGINLEHQESDTEGIYCFESWIIKDPNNDKSNALGMNYPKGTLMKAWKIENEEVFQKIKDKEINGTSIEALTSELETIEQKQNIKIKMNKQSIFSHIKSLFSANESKELATGYFGNSLEEGSIITDKDGEPMPNTEFEFDNKKYMTDDMGAIAKVEEVKKEEQMEEETPAEEPKKEQEDLAKKILELETENADLKAELTKLKENTEKEMVKMKQEIIESRKLVPFTEKPFEEMTSLEKHRFNKSLFS